MGNTDTLDLVAAIYAATLPREDFNRMFDRLDELLFPDGEGGESGGKPDGRLDARALAHIETALGIQERLGRARTDDQMNAAILESVPNPSYLVRRSELVVAANAMALARYGRMPTMLRDLVVDPGVRRKVRDFIVSGDSRRLFAVAGHADPDSDSQTSVLVKRVDPALLKGSDEPCFLLSVVDFGFGDAAVELFRGAYGLTQAEVHVAVLLASGLRLPDIAIERRVSVDTLRTQIKVIKYKTGVRDIPALVRLLCGFSAGALAPTARPFATSPARPVSGPLKLRQQITLPDGRRLQYVEQGAHDGEPVLMFHNLPYGVELPDAAIHQAHRDRLRFIAPFRPGFGGSDMVAAASGDELLDKAATDARELLAHLGIARAVVVSHSTSAAFALRFARLFPDRVARLIGVGRAPIWRDAWAKETPQRQRFMLRMAKHVPQMLPVVAWAMVSVMDSAYAADFVAYNCKDGRADAAALQVNPEIADLISRGSVEALRNGLDGFCRECRISLLDFTEEARATPHKFHILHGREDVIVRPEHSLAFADAVPGTVVELVEGAGQLLFFSHWQYVIDAVRRQAPDHRLRAAAVTAFA